MRGIHAADCRNVYKHILLSSALLSVRTFLTDVFIFAELEKKSRPFLLRV